MTASSSDTADAGARAPEADATPRPSPRAQLFAALLEARRDCPALVAKASRNQELGYAYAGHDAVITGGSRDALLRNSLLLTLIHTELVGIESYETRGGMRAVWRWRGRFLLAHVAGGELELALEATTAATDKAGYIAATALDRTAHLRVLELASGQDDPELERDTGRTGDTGPRTRAATQAHGASALTKDLAACSTEDALAVVGRRLLREAGKVDERAPQWREFVERCRALELSWRSVMARAQTATRALDVGTSRSDIGSRHD